jgi:3',5'-cyclic AMP phosphodiesterase CpdA
MLRFVHISDTHLGPDKNFKLYGRNTYQDADALVEHLNTNLGFEPAFILHTGDVTDDADAPATQLAAELFGRLLYPVYYVRGNHDAPAFLRQYLMGQPASAAPLYYDFQRQGFHFLVLDSHGQPDPQGHISGEQLAWLEATCAASTAESLVLCLHHLPLKMGIPWLDENMCIQNTADLWAVLRPHRARLRGVFFGHIHRAFTGFYEGILCSATGSGFAQFHTIPDAPSMMLDTAALGAYSLVTLTHSQTTLTHHTLPRQE